MRALVPQYEELRGILHPRGVLESTAGHLVGYVANSNASLSFPNTVSVIETASNSVVATISVGSGPFGVAMVPISAGVGAAACPGRREPVVVNSRRPRRRHQQHTPIV